MAVEATTSPFPPRLPAWQQPDIARANSCLEKRKFNQTLPEPILALKKRKFNETFSKPILASPLRGHHCPWVLLAQSDAPPGVGVFHGCLNLAKCVTYVVCTECFYCKQSFDIFHLWSLGAHSTSMVCPVPASSTISSLFWENLRRIPLATTHRAQLCQTSST